MNIAIFVVCPMLVVTFAHGQDDNKNSKQKGDSEFAELLESLRKEQPPNWKYRDLAKQADVIVIAKTLSTTHAKWDKNIVGEFGGKSLNCISNKMRVLSVLKGKPDDEIEFVTVKWKGDRIILVNSDFAQLHKSLSLPKLITVMENDDEESKQYFGSHPIESYMIEPEYLLYLRKLDGNRYVPVTGQRWGRYSVRILNK